MKDKLIGFLLCLCLVLGTAAAFRGFGPCQIKAMGKVIVEEFNRGREWDASLRAAVAASTSFADFKTRVAALPARPNITADQVRDQLEVATDTIATNLVNDPDLSWMRMERP